MHITAIGISGSGKTCYLAALYEVLGASNIQGFKLKPRASDYVESVVLGGKLESLSFAGQNFKFPPGTTKTTIWNFELFHQDSLITNVSWLDYRGGILSDVRLSEESNPEKEDELQTVLAHILLSDALMLFVDSIPFTYYDNLREASRASGINTIGNLLSNYALLNSRKPPTVIVVLTKVDAIDEKWKANNFTALVERAQKAFQITIGLQSMKANWSIGIVPVSSVGEGNAQTKIIMPQSINEPLITTTQIINYPAPMNIGESFFYCVGQTFLKAKKETQKEIVSLQSERLSSLEKMSIGNHVWAWLTKRPTPEQIVAELVNEKERLSTILATIEPYIETLNLLSLEKVRMF